MTNSTVRKPDRYRQLVVHVGGHLFATAAASSPWIVLGLTVEAFALFALAVLSFVIGSALLHSRQSRLGQKPLVQSHTHLTETHR